MLYSLPNIPEQRNPRRSATTSDSIPSRTFSSNYYLPSVSAKPERSKTILLPSKNLFTTVLKEETEEIIEDDFGADQTPLSGDFTVHARQLPKTVPELHRLNTVPQSELAEENKLRGKRVAQYLEDLQKLTSSQDYQLDTRCQFRDRKSNTDLRDRILRLGENMCNLYNIQFNIIEMTKQDSLMKVEKMRDRFVLAKFSELIIKEIAKFPYSFFKKIGLSSLSFCQDVEFFKEQSNPMVTKKLMSGMFPLAKFSNSEEVIDHFYRVIFFHLRNQITDLDSHWAKVYIRKSKAVMHISMNVIVTQSTKAKKSFFDEQWKLYKELILCPNRALKHESNVIRIKAFKLKDCMEAVDPDGITEDWWKKRGLSLVVGSLDHL